MGLKNDLALATAGIVSPEAAGFAQTVSPDVSAVLDNQVALRDAPTIATPGQHFA